MTFSTILEANLQVIDLSEWLWEKLEIQVYKFIL